MRSCLSVYSQYFFKSVLTAMFNLTLPLLTHHSSSGLTTLVEMCSKGLISGAKVWIWVTYLSSLRSLMVRSPHGLSFVRNLCYVFAPTGILHTNHCPLVLLHTPFIPSRDPYFTPFQVGGCVMISLKFFI